MRLCISVLAGLTLLISPASRGATDVASVPKMEPAMIKTYVGPEYPYEARRRRLQGTGLLLIEINGATGEVIGANMAVSTGHPMLDRAAVTAFRQWRFKPGTPKQIKTPITFTLSPGRIPPGYAVRSKPMDEVLAGFLGKGTVLKGPIPDYPKSPSWTTKSGKGVYELHVGRDGRVARVNVAKSSGDATFDRISVNTLGKWRLRRGPLVLELPLSFTLTPTNYSVDVRR